MCCKKISPTDPPNWPTSKPTFPQFCHLLPVVVMRGRFGKRLGNMHKCRPRSAGKGKSTKLNCSANFKKIKKRLSAAGLLHCRIQGGLTSLRILPQEATRIVKKMYPYKVQERHRIFSSTVESYFYLECS